MSEETENSGGFFSNLKNQIMTGAGVILTGLGTMFMDEVKSFIGIGDDEEQAQTEQVQQNNQQSQSVNVSGPEIIINIPEQKQAETKTVYVKDTTARKPVKKKEKEELLDW
jgi:hypothetical protein